MSVTPGVFVNATEIMPIPASGTTWTAMNKVAIGTWGTPTIASQDAKADVNTLAGAIVAVRTNNEALKQKVRSQIMALVATHPYDRVLAASRELPCYIISADLVGLDSVQKAAFIAFLDEVNFHAMEGHSGGKNMYTTALYSPNNWGTMARAAVAAIASYKGDAAMLNSVATAQRAFLGEAVPNSLKYTSTNWHTASPKVGINPRGASRNGNSLDGVIPEDQRRTGEYAWPAPKGSYPHEALQGAVLASVILARAGVLDFNAGDSALIRAETWLATVNGNPASGDDYNTPRMLNKYGKSTFPTSSSITAGKNIAWTGWLYS